MSTKGKGKKKDKKDKDPNKMGQVDKSFYELTIADLNQKLQQQRCTLIHLEEDHAALTEKLRVLEEDRVDIAAHLERTLIDRNNRITELEERLLEITKVRNVENRTSSETIKNMEIKYKAMHDQLTSEIKLLNGKLNSLDEFRIQRDVMMAKFEDQEQTMNEKENSYREIIYNMEQKQVVEKDALKKEVEAKLLQVSEDFTRSSEIRNAGYTRRLIRENIALQKEIDTVVIAQIKAHNQLEEKEQKQQEIMEQYKALKEIRDQLISNGQNKMKIIEKLTRQYELIKNKFIEANKYRNLYEKITSRDVCDRFTVKDLKRKMRILTELIDTLKRDKKQMAAHHVSHENEIIRLRTTINSIKSTLQASITGTDNYKKAMKVLKPEETLALADDLDPEQRKSLLKELVNILAAHTSKFPETPSASTVSEGAPVYKTGKLGFLQPSESSILNTFRYQTNPNDIKGPPLYALRHQDSTIIPKERQNINFIIDVEIGDPLYVSSSKDEVEVEQVQVEQHEDAEAEEQESSEMQSSMSETSVQKTDVKTEKQEQVKAVSSKSSGIKLTTSKPIKKDEASSTYDEEEEQEEEEDDDGEEEDFVQFFY